MAIELFRFDNDGIKLSKPEIMLTPEFNSLIDKNRNKTKKCFALLP